MASETLDKDSTDIPADLDLLDSDEESDTKADPKEETDISNDEEGEAESEKEETEEVSEGEEEIAAKSEDEIEEEVVTRLSYKEIKEKFPDIFKKIPELREVFYAEKAYREIYPTVEEAREAAEKSDIYDGLNTVLFNGRMDILLGRVLTEPAQEKIVENFLPALEKHSKQLFAKATEPFVARLLNEAFDHAETIGDKNLSLSVKNICKFLYGRHELPSTKGREKSPEIEKERAQLQNEKREIYIERASEAKQKVDKSIENRLRRSIENGLDKEENLSDFVKDSIINKTLEEVSRILQTDRTHMGRMASLWKLAERGRFSPEHITRLVSTYLSRAERLALGLRGKHKAAAQGKREPSTSSPRKVPASTSIHPRATSSKSISAKEIDWSKTDDLAFLNDNVTSKKRV